MATRNVTITNGNKVQINKTEFGYEYKGYQIVKNYKGVWCCVECFDELECGGEWFVQAKNLKDAVEKVNMWTETEEEEAARKAIQNEKLEAAQAELEAAQAERKAAQENNKKIVVKTKKVTCENGAKINIEVTEKGYKVNGFFIQKISITNQWFNNVSRSVQYTSKTVWGYSTNQLRIEKNTCRLADTLKDAVSGITKNWA